MAAPAKPKRVVLTKNQKKRLKKKEAQKQKAEAPAPEKAPAPAPAEDPAEKVTVEYVSASYDGDASLALFQDVFAKFATAEALTTPQAEVKAAPTEEKKAEAAEEEVEEKEMSKKQRKAATRMTVAELKQSVAHPEVVEAHDVTAGDPKLLVLLKSTRNTVPVPRHWCHKRRYLQGKRGMEKKPWQLPEFIAQTGIEKIRRAVEEANAQKKVAALQRDRVAPKMGRMDVDYQVLHDAFFKWQTKPAMSGHGELYYEGKEFEVHLKQKRPGTLSASLKAALGMPDGAPPPWLINMQRYGPPPSYPHLRIPGLNAPIPDGASFGYHPGGWGKPPVDEYGRPLYGDVFGAGAPQEQRVRPEDVVHWGEMTLDVEDDRSEDEGFEAADFNPMARTAPVPRVPLSSMSSTDPSDTSGIETPLDDGISSSLTGMETPDAIDLRKRAGMETPDSSSAASEKPLYTVLEQEKARARGGAGTLFASDKRYNVSGVAVSLDPDTIDGQLADQRRLQEEYAAGRAKGSGDDEGVGLALREGMAGQKRKIDGSREKAAKKQKEKDAFKF
mmetsp:Transcript_12843/g.38240  ORF Transcript_12843/g.38240 Transcript_12843/m.38240 type:complete len:557 (-) Transcript_12843:44-1714(-)